MVGCSEIKKGRDWREVLFHTSSPVSNNIPDICKDINKYCLSYTDDTYKKLCIDRQTYMCNLYYYETQNEVQIILTDLKR